MKTTLNQIRKHSPCTAGWTKLLRSLNKAVADDEPLDIAYIVKSNGLGDALWCLRAVQGHDKEIRLFGVWCARQVQHLMKDPRSVAALDVAERFAHGEATLEELDAARAAAGAAARDAAAYAARAAAAQDAAADAAQDAACAAADAAAWTAAAADAAADAADAAAWTAARAAAADAAWAAACAAACATARTAARDAAMAAARGAQTAKLLELCGVDHAS